MSDKELKLNRISDTLIAEADWWLDFAIAECVMNWHAIGGCWFNSDDESRYYTYEWNPRHRIDHAWQVVEWLQVEYLELYFVDEIGWDCNMCSEKVGWGDAIGETKAHAICLAALAAMEANG